MPFEQSPVLWDNALATVQVGDYEMIFDKGSMDGGESMNSNNDGFEAEGDYDIEMVPAPVMSNVLQSNNGPSNTFENRTSSHPPLFKMVGSLQSSRNQSPSSALFDTDIDTDLQRLRTRQEPKQTSAEVLAAYATMDKEILSQGPPKKRRGRPKGSTGLKKITKPLASATRSGSGTPTTASGAGMIKKRGRPAKAPDLSARELYEKSKPDYRPFRCGWYFWPAEDANGNPTDGPDQCPAELHNLETLRKHLDSTHGNEDWIYGCRWDDCCSVDRCIFQNQQEWREHMEEHLVPFSWRMGDGIQNRGIDKLQKQVGTENLPGYLFKDGVQVTPSVKDQEFDTTNDTLQRRRNLREMLRLAEENAPTDLEFREQLLGKPVQPRLKRRGSSS